MAVDQRKSIQTIWAVVLTVMGILLCLKTPYALRQAPVSASLNFVRYFVGILLIVGGIRKLYSVYFANSKESSPEK